MPLSSILLPNNGLHSFCQFDEAVNTVLKFVPPFDSVIQKAVTTLKSFSFDVDLEKENKKEIKLSFLMHQLELLSEKRFSVNDYCFAVESFPNSSYEQLRDYLVLPSKRKIQSIISSVGIEDVLHKTFLKLKHDQQKNAFLLVDEVTIRPIVSFAGGVLNGMAKNNVDCRATAMLCVMMKLLYKGPSVMVSITPVYRLTAEFQFKTVVEAATLVENAGGIVLGSITDNNRVNQSYGQQFGECQESSSIVPHPFSDDINKRVWFLLADTVHLLKCIRNNWISEKTKQISLDNVSTASFEDIVNLYNEEKDSILKTTKLTQASVKPSRLQLQNVQHVLKVFNEKVIAALTLKGCHETSSFLQTVVNWWNVVNVAAKGQDQRLNDPYCAVQEIGSNSLEEFVSLFQKADSGQGPSRQKCLTHDTQKALVRTMEGLKAVCEYLLTTGNFKYVILRELQSDRIEGEFGVYRQSTGANNFMTAGDVFHAGKKRLTQFAAKYLGEVNFETVQPEHDCLGTDIVIEDAVTIQHCLAGVILTSNEASSEAYVASWLESKCVGELEFTDEEPFVTSEVKAFIETVSRGKLLIPHSCTFQLVRLGLSFLKGARHRVCCRNRFVQILSTLATLNENEFTSNKLFRHLSNVLLSGLHNLEKDHQKNATLYQTSSKKARMASI